MQAAAKHWKNSVFELVCCSAGLRGRVQSYYSNKSQATAVPIQGTLQSSLPYDHRSD